MTLIFKPERFHELATQSVDEPNWLWQGYLAPGSITLLTSQWKTGKTTLLSVLLSRLHQGGELAGQAVRRGRAAVISEESRVHWRMRGKRLDFGPDTCFLCRPFLGSPSEEDWQTLIDELLKLHAEQGLDLVVIDTIATLFPAGTEHSADQLLRVLRPLERLTDAGMAVLLLHHPRKGTVQPGQAARGSGALTAYVDIMIEMNYAVRLQRKDRRRHLAAWSRFESTPDELTIKLNDEGNDYQLCRDEISDDLDKTLQITTDLLLNHERQMSRALLHQRWPEEAKPAPSTLWKHLERLVELGKLTRCGSGERQDPFRYSLPELDLPWSWDGDEDVAEWRLELARMAG